MELTEEGISLAEMALETGDLWDENDPWARYLLVTTADIIYVPNGNDKLWRLELVFFSDWFKVSVQLFPIGVFWIYFLIYAGLL